MAKMDIGGVKQSFADDEHCGDQFGYWQKGDQITLCIADGLGHGKYAEIAARAAMSYVASHLTNSLPEIFFGCNQEIRDTRGGAMGIAIIDKKACTLTYAGIGNTRILILRSADLNATDRKPQYLRSNFGIVGAGYKHLVPETVSFAPGDLVMMYTDGVKEMISFTGYEALLYKNIQELAEKIIKDWGRDTDDAAVLTYTWD
jgi:serine/threonine protein phosphatase PrpC